jgi:hypothetical protein
LREHLLVFVKRAINGWARGAVKAVPGVYARKPVSRLTRQLFEMLQKGLGLQDKAFYEDKNFPRLLEALEKTLIFVAEEDPHYAGWLAEAMLLCSQVVQESRREFPPGAEGDALWISWAIQAKVKGYKQIG